MHCVCHRRIVREYFRGKNATTDGPSSQKEMARTAWLGEILKCGRATSPSQPIAGRLEQVTIRRRHLGKKFVFIGGEIFQLFVDPLQPLRL